MSVWIIGCGENISLQHPSIEKTMVLTVKSINYGILLRNSADCAAQLMAAPTHIKAKTSLVETDLVNRLLQGDQHAFRELIKQHHRLMLSVARAIVGDAFAEDVVQDAWTAVYTALPRFEGRSALKTWILTIVANEARARLRRDSRMTSLNELDGEEPGSYLDQQHFRSNGHWQTPVPQWGNESPEALLEEKQLQHCIAKTLNILPPLQKAAFLLRDVEQQPFDDICTLLNVSSANVRVLLHRARLTLMQMIDRYQETGTC